MNKKELFEKLNKADEEISMIYSADNKVKVVIGGGSVLLIKGYLNRQTPDIDTLGTYNEIENVFNKYDINSRMNAYSDCIPENYEDRLEKVNMNTKILDFYTLSLEDLVIMKLFSHRGKDYKDITNPIVIKNLNWELLENIVRSGELDYSFNSRKYDEFLIKFNTFIRNYKPS